MPARDDLQKLVSVLSDYECEQLMRSVGRTIDGAPSWEHDIALMYNEDVKLRSWSVEGSGTGLAPGSPETGGVFAPIPVVKHYPEGPRLALPPPPPLRGELADVLGSRRSHRDFDSAPLQLERLSALLGHALGKTGETVGYGYSALPLRSFPSSGGLQSPETYLVVRAVDEVPAGVYHYDPVRHGLDPVTGGDHSREIAVVALGQPYVATASAVAVLCASYERLRWKYGERAYRYACMDVGFATQNLYLVGEALGLGVCAVAGFLDDPIERLVGVDGDRELALLLVAIGPRRSALSTEADGEDPLR